MQFNRYIRRAGYINFTDSININKTTYDSGGSRGVSFAVSGKATDKNKAGVTPSIGMPAEGKAESTTKAGVAAGKIEITYKR